MLVCIIENRGMGRSSCPRDSVAYSTSIMAHDVVAVMVSGQWCGRSAAGSTCVVWLFSSRLCMCSCSSMAQVGRSWLYNAIRPVWSLRLYVWFRCVLSPRHQQHVPARERACSTLIILGL
jgi:hypothetical protein